MCSRYFFSYQVDSIIRIVLLGLFTHILKHLHISLKVSFSLCFCQSVHYGHFFKVPSSNKQTIQSIKWRKSKLPSPSQQEEVSKMDYAYFFVHLFMFLSFILFVLYLSVSMCVCMWDHERTDASYVWFCFVFFLKCRHSLEHWELIGIKVGVTFFFFFFEARITKKDGR